MDLEFRTTEFNTILTNNTNINLTTLQVLDVWVRVVKNVGEEVVDDDDATEVDESRIVASDRTVAAVDEPAVVAAELVVAAEFCCC